MSTRIAVWATAGRHTAMTKAKNKLNLQNFIEPSFYKYSHHVPVLSSESMEVTLYAPDYVRQPINRPKVIVETTSPVRATQTPVRATRELEGPVWGGSRSMSFCLDGSRSRYSESSGLRCRASPRERFSGKRNHDLTRDLFGVVCQFVRIHFEFNGRLWSGAEIPPHIEH